MVVVTAYGGTAEDRAAFRSIVQRQSERCKGFGYAHHEFGLTEPGGEYLPGYSFEVPVGDFMPTVNGDSLPPATFKAALMDNLLRTLPANQWACWLDADCLPLREFDPLHMEGGHAFSVDAVVTLRSHGEIGLSRNQALDYLNSGVVWIRNTLMGRKFCEAWRRHSIELQTDQGALNLCVAPEWTEREWKMIAGQNAVVDSPTGAKVLVLDAAEWNRWHLPPTISTRILHFKRGIRSQAVNYL